MPFNETCFKDNESYLRYDEYTTPLPKIVSDTKKYKNKAKLKSNTINLYDLIAIKFPSEGEILSGFITIKYRYNSNNGIINYSDIKYSIYFIIRIRGKVINLKNLSKKVLTDN